MLSNHFTYQYTNALKEIYLYSIRTFSIIVVYLWSISLKKLQVYLPLPSFLSYRKNNSYLKKRRKRKEEYFKEGYFRSVSYDKPLVPVSKKRCRDRVVKRILAPKPVWSRKICKQILFCRFQSVKNGSTKQYTVLAIDLWLVNSNEILRLLPRNRLKLALCLAIVRI